MFFSFQKRRSAAPSLAKSRVRASRRLLVEGLEERRVMDAGGIIAAHNFVQASSAFTTAGNVVIPVEIGTTNAEAKLNIDWFVFLDDGSNGLVFASPGNGVV